jgi:hypothetical protein
MNLSRETTPGRVNAILNHPAVRPWVANGSEPLDVTAQIANTRNVFLFGEHGGVGFLQSQPGVYEAHTQVLPEGRGEWTREMTEAAVGFMFTCTDAYEITTRIPAGHIAAKAAAEAQGMRFEFTRENGVMFRNRTVDCHVYSFRVQDWVPRGSGLIEMGQWLHRRMDEEAARLGLTIPTHEDDENHNRYVGAAVRMMFGGQWQKAISFYNRWVTLARHARNGELQHVSLVSGNPLIIRFDIGLMRFHPDDIEVILPC